MSRAFLGGLGAALLITFAVPATASAAAPGKCVDLHTATAKDIQSLKGAGPKIAKAIIDYRKAQRGKATKDKRVRWNYNNWASVMKVPGVGPRFCQDNLAAVCFGGKVQKACPAVDKKPAPKPVKKLTPAKRPVPPKTIKK